MGKYIDYLDIQEEVKAALEEHRGVVALESTIISHGMPYPQNVEMAKNCERIIRKAGAVPATIAIIDGRIKNWSFTGGFAEAGQCGYCDEGFQKRSGSGSG